MTAARFWTREIWGPAWDSERRALLARHYWSYLRHRPVPPEYMERPGPTAVAAQRFFSEHYRRTIDAVQAGATVARGVRLTYRPIGKNLRHVATELRRNVARGHATYILPDGPPGEVAALAKRGQSWRPWLWSRSGAVGEERRDAAAAWQVLFSRPSREPVRSGAAGAAPAVPPIDGWSGSALARVLELAAATNYVFSPVGGLEREVAALRSRIGWPGAGVPVLGLHVRRGDAASTEEGAPRKSTRASFPMSAYLDAADAICSRHGIRHIFLATESSVEAERAMTLRPQYTFLCLPHDRAVFPAIATSGQFIEDLALTEPQRAGALARAAIFDLAMFARCSAFVGAFNSEFSVLAWLLTIGGQAHLVPYCSLSKPATHVSLHPYDALLNLRNNCPLELYHW